MSAKCDKADSVVNHMNFKKSLNLYHIGVAGFQKTLIPFLLPKWSSPVLFHKKRGQQCNVRAEPFILGFKTYMGVYFTSQQVVRPFHSF